MLKTFSVENFMGFKDKFIFDLSSNKKYVNTANPNMVEKGIVKNALIFGPNGSGKSNLCSALMDITFHLVDKEKLIIPNNIYLNADKMDVNDAKFEYHFKFGRKDVVYEYAKKSCMELCYEKIYVNNTIVLEYHYFDDSHNINKIPGAENLNKVRLPQQLSMVKYIFSNTVQDEDSVIRMIIDFVNGMLYFKSLLEGNRYMGYRLGSDDMSSLIINNNKLSDFQEFLKENGLNYNLVITRNLSGFPVIGVRFAGRVVEFSQVISSGTKTLWLFYCWLLEFNKLTLLVIDEFDAYYHYDLGMRILKIINSFTNYQSIISTHNTYLMRKEVTRPDCCYIINNSEKIKPICKLTKKEIRDYSDLEKMYRSGKFVDW